MPFISVGGTILATGMLVRQFDINGINKRFDI